MKKEVLTPKEFARQMREIADGPLDTEGVHVDADRLMTRVLIQLGYATGVKIYQRMERGYE